MEKKTKVGKMRFESKSSAIEGVARNHYNAIHAV